MKTLKTSLLLCFAFLITSCGNTDNSQAAKDTRADSAAVHGEHQHTYACPMHPDVISDKPGSCPKCGMDLVHNDNAKSSKEYFMQFAAVPANVDAGKQVTLSFTPKVKGNENEPVPLDVVHEKKIHLIIVSSDLSFYDHQHPEYSATGSYDLSFTFPFGGDFVLFADYMPTGGGGQVERISLSVAGKQPVSKKYDSPSLTTSVDGYTVELKTDEGKFYSGRGQHIDARVMKDGKPVLDFENLMGAKGHFVVISADAQHYLHVHPDSEPQSPLHFHTAFDTPGFYRGFLQFQIDGKIHTADFVLKVEQGAENAKTEGHEYVEGEHHHDDHEGHSH